MVTSFVFALFATFGFCILFHVPLRCMLPAAAIGEVRLGRTKEGHYRKLTREEIEYLKNC